MSTIIESIEQRQLRKDLPRFKAGDTVRVHFQVIEGQRRRVQVFEGIVIKRQGSGVRETFTVRKQSFGVGVERTFPVHSPKIEKIEVARDRRRQPREALLPAREDRQEGARARAAPDAGPGCRREGAAGASRPQAMRGGGGSCRGRVAEAAAAEAAAAEAAPRPRPRGRASRASRSTRPPQPSGRRGDRGGGRRRSRAAAELLGVSQKPSRSSHGP